MNSKTQQDIELWKQAQFWPLLECATNRMDLGSHERFTNCIRFVKWGLLWDFLHRSACRPSSALCFAIYFEVWQDFGAVVKLRWVSCVRSEFRQTTCFPSGSAQAWYITMPLWPLVLHSCIYTPTGPTDVYYLLIVFNSVYTCIR